MILYFSEQPSSQHRHVGRLCRWLLCSQEGGGATGGLHTKYRFHSQCIGWFSRQLPLSRVTASRQRNECVYGDTIPKKKKPHSGEHSGSQWFHFSSTVWARRCASPVCPGDDVHPESPVFPCRHPSPHCLSHLCLLSACDTTPPSSIPPQPPPPPLVYLRPAEPYASPPPVPVCGLLLWFIYWICAPPPTKIPTT